MCPVTRFRSADYLKFLIGLRKISTKRCDQSHIFFAVQTILSFEWGFEKFRQKCVPSYTFSQRRLSWVFEGTWKVSTKRCDQLHIFFRRADYLKFLRGLGKCRQKAVTSCTFLAVQTIASFWWDLEKFSQKCVPSYTFSQRRLSWVLEGTWKVSTKRCD